MPKFEKGKSGNPGGRPKILAALKENGLDAGKLTAELVKELIAVVRSKEKGSASWRFAVETLMNHVVGKPKEVIEHTFTQGDIDDEDLANMTNDELDAYIAKLTTQAREGADSDSGDAGSDGSSPIN